MFRRWLACSVLTLIGGLGTVEAQDAAALIQRGRPLPRLLLPKVDGSGSLDLADLKGQKVLLIQFASW